MDRESEYLLSLLRDFLLEREPEKAQDVAWDKLWQLAQIHNVMGIVGYMAMRHGICPDAAMASRLRFACLQTVTLYTQRHEQAKKRLQALCHAGIAYIAMKGLVLRDFYPVPELRTYGDIDLVIQQGDREKCHELFLDWGFQVKTDWEPVYSYTSGNEFYEMHTRIMEVDISSKADYQSYFDRAWEHARETENCRYEFTPEFHFIYLLTHIAKHVQGAGAGARMYLDIAAFIRHYREDLDWALIRRELEGLALWDFACTVLSAVESWFSVACPMAFTRADTHVLERFGEFTMEAGVFGQYGRERGMKTLRKADGTRTSTLLRRVFPKAESIEARYTYLQGRHWLLPVAWVHRLIKTRKSWGDHAHEAKVILTADEKEVSRLQSICKEIGL